LQDCFEEQINNEYRTFPQLLRVIESFMPALHRPPAGIGRKSCQYLPFFRSRIAKSFSGIGKTVRLIQRLTRL